MKSINTIISNHILSNPLFSNKLQKIKCNQKIKLLFELKLGINPKICNSISYFSKKNNILLIAISHPAYAMELKYYSTQIIKLLKNGYEDNIIDIKECLKEFNNIKKIQTFIPKIIKQNNTNIIKQNNKYKEKSKAIFINHLQNQNLKNDLEEIRQIILNNTKKEQNA